MVSLLVPCYNGEKFIRRCLECCINQTYKEIEIIVVNDGSTDDSEKIIKEYQLRDNRIKLINQQNKGLAETRNVLINNVKGEFFFFIDVDDIVDLDCIETYVNSIKDNDLVINSCYITKNNKDKVFYITNKIDTNTTKESFLINNAHYAWGILYRTNYFKENNFSFNGKFPFFEDVGVMTYVIYKTDKIVFLNDPKYHYYFNKESLVHTKMSKEKIEQAIAQLKNLYSWLERDFKKGDLFPKCINDELTLHFCVIFTYIQFQSKLKRTEKKQFKKELKELEKTHQKLKFPKRYWKWWYFLLYRLYGY